MKKLKKLVKILIPPIFLDLIQLCYSVKKTKWLGGYSSINEARSFSGDGYENRIILKKLLSSYDSVLSGNAIFERDSVLFYNEEYNPNFLLFLLELRIGLGKKEICFVDFGGGIASLFFQHKKALSNFKYKWFVVERKNLVSELQKRKQVNNLFFCDNNNLNETVKTEGIDNALILSSVLNYLDSPYEELIRLVGKLKPEVIYIDRTIFSKDGSTKFYIQIPPKEIFNVKIPCIFLSVEKIKEYLIPEYVLVYDLGSIGIAEDYFEFKCLIFRKRK